MNPQDDGFTRVEPASFQNVEANPVRPWFPDQRVDAAAWSFEGNVYGEPVGGASGDSRGSADGAEGDGDNPSPEELTAALEEARAEQERARQEHGAELAQLQEPYTAAVTRLDQACVSLDQRFSQSSVSLALLLAETLLAREAAVDEAVLTTNLNRALDRVGPVEHLRIEANAADVERLREIVPDLAAQRTGRAVDVIVTASDRLTRGGMVLSFDRGVIDASWGSQLGHLGEAVALAFDEERLTSPASPPSPEASSSADNQRDESSDDEEGTA